MEPTHEKTISDKIIEGLNKAITEMEELRVQAALGKYEARDLYEEAKTKFNHTYKKQKKNSISIKLQ